MLSMPVHTHTYAEGYISSFKHTLMNIQIDVFYKHIPSSSREISTVVPPPQPSIRRDLSPVAWRARRPKAGEVSMPAAPLALVLVLGLAAARGEAPVPLFLTLTALSSCRCKDNTRNIRYR